MQDKSRFTKMMTAVAESCNKAISEAQIDFYWDMLKSFDLKDIWQAFKSHICIHDDKGHFPSLQELLELLEFVTRDPKTKAEQAWIIVESVFRKAIRFEDSVLTDPITRIVLDDMGGWMDSRVMLHDVDHHEIAFKNLYLNFLNNLQKGVEDCK